MKEIGGDETSANGAIDPYRPPADPGGIVGERPPHTRLGIASFVCALLAVAGVALYFGGAGYVGLSAMDGGSPSTGVIVAAVAGLIGAFGMSGLGTLLGVASLFRTRKRRVLGIVGLATSGLIFAGYVVLIVLGMTIAASARD